MRVLEAERHWEGEAFGIVLWRGFGMSGGMRGRG